MQVVSLIDNYLKRDDILNNLYVFEKDINKGFMQMDKTEICKLYVDTFFQNQGIGKELIDYAINKLHADHLWALEKNIRAISFYENNGFHLTNEKKFEEDTTEYLVKLVK